MDGRRPVAEQVFTVRLTNGESYRIVADSQEHAMHELDRMGMSYVPSSFWMDVKPGDAVYIPNKYVGKIDYTTGVWEVDLPGSSHIQGHTLDVPVRPCKFEHDFSEPDPSDEGYGRSFRIRDDGVGNLCAHELG
jgi:hypothetical protein